MATATNRAPQEETLVPAEGGTDAPARTRKPRARRQPVVPLYNAKLSDKIILVATVALPFLGCIAAIVLLWQFGWMGWSYLSLMLVGWILTGLGITVGFHRMLTHRSFETYSWIRATWTALGALAVEGSPLMWCAVHRKHHQHSDHEGDPHSPQLHGQGWRNMARGFVHAHFGWLFTRYWTPAEMEKYVPDLMQERLLVAVDRVYYLWVLASLAIPTILGGLISMSWFGALLGLVWGGFVRMFITHHITWSINSVCHIFGRRDYDSEDDSRNNWLFGLLAHGEGWHNNHHAFPTSARHGLKWWQLDLSWILIRTMELVGLAWSVRLPSERALAARQL